MADVAVGAGLVERGPTSPARRIGRITPALAVPAAAVAAVLACMSRALVFPALSSNDEAAHVDYAAAVWQGRLPVFDQGLTVRPGFGEVPDVQWVAQHPPLFYALLAPAVGPLAERDHYLAAVLAGRAVNALLAGLAVLAVAWAVRQVAPEDRWLPAVAAVVTAMCAWVLRVGGAVYNDVLGVVVSALLLGLAVRAIRAGPTPGRWFALGVAGAAALATRASLAGVLAAALAGVVLSVALASRAVRPTVRAGLAAVAVGVGAVIPTAWFWARNLRLSGNLLGSHPQWAQENLDRVTRSWSDVAGDPGFWWQTWGLFSHNRDGLVTTTALLLVFPLVAAGAAVVVRRPRLREWRSVGPRDVAVAVTLGGSVAVVGVLAVGFTTTGGGVNPRYVMPALLPVALAVAAGLRAWPPAVRWAVTVWAGVAATDAVVAYSRAVVEYAGVPGVPPTWPVPAAALGAVALGAVALAVAAVWRTPVRVDTT